MNLPSIKLNIFKKLEYWLVLKKLNKQFDAQFKILIDSKNKEGRYTANFPTWECEKKILFWTYGFHKHLGSPLLVDDFLNKYEWYRKEVIKHYENCEAEVKKYREKSEDEINKELENAFTDYYERNTLTIIKKPDEIEKRADRLRDVYLSQNEIINAGVEEVLKNLVQRGFAEECENGKFIISKEGLSFGELFWYLYMPKTNEKYTEVFGVCPRSINRKNEKNLFKLRANFFSLFIMNFQLWSFYGFTLIAGLFISLEILSGVGLLDNLRFISRHYFNENFAIVVLLLPFSLFVLSFVGDIFYSSWMKNWKYRDILILTKND